MKITDFRLSCIWVEGVRQALGTKDVGVLGRCVQAGAYTTLFNQLLSPGNHPLFEIPWPRPTGNLFRGHNRFWNKYVVAKLANAAETDRGKSAWQAVVPLRRKEPLARFERAERCFIEGWYYPHGIALTVTAWFRRQAYDLPALQTTVANFLNEASEITWAAPRAPQPQSQTIKLDGLSRACMDILRSEAFDNFAAAFQSEPLRVLTIVSAEPETLDKNQPDKTDKDLPAARRAVLEAALTAAGANVAATPKPPKGSNIHVFSRGRVIWNPDKALAARKTTHTMGCLHRNITLATTQVASLLTGVDAALAALGEARGAMAPRVELYAKRLTEQVEQIYRDDSTYDQPCLHAQIKEALLSINRLRAAVGLGELK